MESSRLLIANDDMADFESYYWLAPADYVGKKLTAYAQTMKFHVSWVQARGDTGGKATKGPDVIMEGSGMKIGYGDRSYRENNATITWILKEKGWYHIPDTVQDIARKRRTEYKGEAVTKMQFMTIINDLQRLMIRAKFHTDQIEGV
jgi:laminin alpha 1/2